VLINHFSILYCACANRQQISSDNDTFNRSHMTFRWCSTVNIAYLVAVLGFTFWGASGVAIIAAGGTDLYCHSEPPITSGKLCFIINFIGATGVPEYLLGPPPGPALNRP